MNQELLNKKKELREKMRALRRAVKSRDERDARICEKLLSLPNVARASTIAVYLATKDEIDLSNFINALLSRKVNVLSPQWRGSFYALSPLADLSEESLRLGPNNVKEPRAEKDVSHSSVDVWIVPGLAFTTDGKRLGYGGGWFDRMLASASSVKIGVAYDAQIVDDLPFEEHDQKMTFVITEKYG